MSSRFICSIIAFLLIAAGWAGLYAYRFHPNDLVDYLSYGSIYLGWITLLFSWWGKYLLYDRNFRFNKKRPGWRQRRIIQAAVYCIFAVSVILLPAGMRELGNRRNAYLLANTPVAETIGRVTLSGDETNHGILKPRLVINYVVDAHHYSPVLSNRKGLYKSGQTYRILYVINQPDIFRILNEVGY